MPNFSYEVSHPRGGQFPDALFIRSMMPDVFKEMSLQTEILPDGTLAAAYVLSPEDPEAGGAYALHRGGNHQPEVAPGVLRATMLALNMPRRRGSNDVRIKETIGPNVLKTMQQFVIDHEIAWVTDTELVIAAEFPAFI